MDLDRGTGDATDLVTHFVVGVGNGLVGDAGVCCSNLESAAQSPRMAQSPVSSSRLATATASLVRCM